jgi:hypothetical protein
MSFLLQSYRKKLKDFIACPFSRAKCQLMSRDTAISSPDSTQSKPCRVQSQPRQPQAKRFLESMLKLAFSFYKIDNEE